MSEEEAVDFGFPFQPYDIQIGFMRTVYDSIRDGKIALLSSPTGTGKSLSLLCGSLAYLRRYLNSVQDAQTENAADNEVDENLPDWVKAFASKKRARIDTSDIRQPLEPATNADEEFLLGDMGEEGDDFESRLTALRAQYFDAESCRSGPSIAKDVDQPKVIFCSRTHSQLTQTIHELLRTQHSNHIRSLSLGSRKQLCINDNVAKLGSVRAVNDRCLDLQKNDGDKKCPYFPSASEEGVRLQPFKEAVHSKIHDIEDLVGIGRRISVCPYYGSRHAIPSSQFVTMPYSLLLSPSTRKSLGISLQDNIVIIDEAHNLIDHIVQLNSAQISLDEVKKACCALKLYSNKYRSRLNSQNLVFIRQLMLILARVQHYLSSRSADSHHSNGETLIKISDFVHDLKIQHINMFKIQHYLEVSSLGTKLIGFVEKYMADQFTLESKHISPLQNIEKFLMLLNNPESDGRLVMRTQTVAGVDEKITDIRFVLLNPARYFEDVVMSARSVILAGGTMEPLSDFIGQLFPNIPADRFLYYKCGHIIPKENLLTLVVPRGPAGQEFLFNFENRNNADLIRDLGQSLVNICNVVPAGVVVFFPSYSYMELVVERWRSVEAGVWDRLQRKKLLFVEPRESSNLDAVLRDYNEAIVEGSGAIIFSVVGGKMSEGINFANDSGRAVVMIGMPYPNSNSVELQEKMAFMDRLALESQKEESSIPNGQTYYENLCMRAINQSIGRAIRHREDYACVFLLDKRYAYAHIREKLPGWFQPSVVVAKTFAEVIPQTVRFFKHHRTKPDVTIQTT